MNRLLMAYQLRIRVVFCLFQCVYDNLVALISNAASWRHVSEDMNETMRF